MKLKHNLSKQLLTIVILTFLIIYISVAIILPKSLIPLYEKTIYSYLKTPLDIAREDFNNRKINSNIAYIYVNEEQVYSSGNLNTITPLTNEQILEKINKRQGKFSYENKTYYYNTKELNDEYKIIAITDDTYLKDTRKELLEALFPVIFSTLLLILVIVAAWGRMIAEKIEKLKEKVDNLDNENYKEKYEFKTDDELKVLSKAIDEMKKNLQKDEEYKNQMYQNISHDFKTPLTVIKSYIEAIEDGMENEKDGLKIIKQEIQKLEIKVHSLLYLNKLTYYKDMKESISGSINITDILEQSVKKFKMTRPDIKWEINILDKKTTFKGSKDMWEQAVDNILGNFIRYAENEIKITVKNHRIIFYNDGPNVDNKIISDVFTPYKKGIKGQTGLGMSIVQKTLKLLNLSISIKNEKKGVSFIIK
ncbi:MAG: HAMP domain-containing histidine kinase [Bacilli bacterium]|nr:HAMP domain-containing histidine kinase [Bacilli bacterium]